MTVTFLSVTSEICLSFVFPLLCQLQFPTLTLVGIIQCYCKHFNCYKEMKTKVGPKELILSA